MKKPTDKAVSLRYTNNKAPVVTAKGEGVVAEEIIALAKEHDIFIHEDSELTQFLTGLEVGDEIPKQLYVVIAELISFSYILQGKFPKKWQNIHKKIDHKV